MPLVKCAEDLRTAYKDKDGYADAVAMTAKIEKRAAELGGGDEAEYKAIQEYHKEIFDKLNDIKTKVVGKPDTYAPKDNKTSIPSINQKYDEQLKSLKDKFRQDNSTKQGAASEKVDGGQKVPNPSDAKNTDGSTNGPARPTDTSDTRPNNTAEPKAEKSTSTDEAKGEADGGIGISKKAIEDKYGKKFEKTKIGWNDRNSHN